ncbi:MAG: isochorismate synthase [Actinomycetota bacterium]|nr:isochorismate synthase [Actinomycetota bacterium]
MTVIAPPRLLARTVEVDPVEDLLTWLPPEVDAHEVVSWVREGEGIVGWGRAAGCMPHGPDRFAAAEAWWQRVAEQAEVVDRTRLPGTGLVAFGSFGFSADSLRGSAVVVPRVVVGRRDGRSWVTTIDELPGPGPLAPPPPPLTGNHHVEPVAPWRHWEDPVRSRPDAGGAGEADDIRLSDGAVAAADWPAVVAAAVTRIIAGEVDKVVLARDLLASSDAPIQVGQMLRRLADRYAATWTFAVDGLVGATPEMLVRLERGRVRSRVLAGTVRRDRTPAPSVTEAHPDLDTAHASDPRLRLVSSDKELEEHGFAVRSVAEALGPHCAELTVPDEPFVLELPDVYHLASDLVGTLRDGATSLRLAAALHPSAAVCGTPASAAARVIAELEGMDRGRYAGPVGWMDASGDGDWGIALRCGQLSQDEKSMRLFAGGGIVAASDPQTELAETEVKFAAMRHALGI